jgi:hypothetical protein
MIGDDIRSARSALRRLIATSDYQRLQTLRPEFGLLQFLGDSIGETAWSGVLAALLDPSNAHSLGTRPLRAWLPAIDGRQSPHLKHILRLLAPARHNRVRISVEHCAPDGRRFDVLIRVIDIAGRVVGVLAIENKLDSPEQETQVSGYQRALVRMFPKAFRTIVYLTPDGRAPRTAEPNAECPCLPCSYESVVKMCATLSLHAKGDLRLLIHSLERDIKQRFLRESRMTEAARTIVTKLWRNPKHRQAMRLICQVVPSFRQLCVGSLEPAIRATGRRLGLDLDHGSVEYYPQRDRDPWEIKVHCGVLNALTEKSGFSFCFMLRSSGGAPDVGTEFRFQLAAWCDTEQARRRVRALALPDSLPTCAHHRNWSSWESIWTGKAYELVDFSARDKRELHRIWREGVVATYATVLKKARRLK